MYKIKLLKILITVFVFSLFSLQANADVLVDSYLGSTPGSVCWSEMCVTDADGVVYFDQCYKVYGTMGTTTDPDIAGGLKCYYGVVGKKYEVNNFDIFTTNLSNLITFIQTFFIDISGINTIDE